MIQPAKFAAIVLFIGIAAQAGSLVADEPEREFASTTIDLGVVTSDVEKAVKFYTEAIGFQEAEGFFVPGDFCKDVGLTDGHRLDIRVLTLGDGPQATKLKLMSLPGVDSDRQDVSHIHSTLGFSYITVHVGDMTKALARLKKAGVKPIAKGSQPLPKNLPQGMFLALVRDPDGNLIELLGPKK